MRINISAVLTVATLSFPLVVATKNDPQNLPAVPVPTSTVTAQRHDSTCGTDIGKPGRLVTALQKLRDWRIANADEMAEAILDGPWESVSPTSTGIAQRHHDSTCVTDISEPGRLATALRTVDDWRIANADVMAEAVLDGPWQDISHVLEDEGDVTLDELDSICPHSDGDSDTSKLIIKVVGFCFIPLAARLIAAVAWAVARRCFRRGRLDDSLQGESEPPPSSDAEGTSEDSQGPTVAQSATAPEDTENGGDGGGNGGDRPDGDANGDEGNGDGSGDGDAQGDGGGVNDNHENNGDNGNHGEANADTNVDYKNNSDNGATDDHEEGGIPETLPQLAGGSREETNDRVRLATERAEVQPPDGA